MTAHAPSTTTSVAAQVAGLPHLSMDDLWKLWDEHFDERPGHHHRGWLDGRLAYRIQERAFGGLKPSLRKKLEEVGETGTLYVHPRTGKFVLKLARADYNVASLLVLDASNILELESFSRPSESELVNQITLAESSRLYSPAIARLTPLTMVETGEPSFSNCSAQ